VDLQPHVDPDRLRTLRDDYGDVATQLLGVFETTATATVGELRAALAAGERDEVRRLAHRLKGSARNVGATGLADLAAALEREPPDAPAALGRLDAALEPTSAQLRAALASA
jgi:HPt (histidine-containing phosphotransfer) domain-containing protein